MLAAVVLFGFLCGCLGAGIGAGAVLLVVPMTVFRCPGCGLPSEDNADCRCGCRVVPADCWDGLPQKIEASDG